MRAAMLLVFLAAIAQQPQQPPVPPPKQPARTVVQPQPRRTRRVIRIAETKIEGRIQKPQAFYILQRSNLSFEGLELKQSFVPKIVDSVREPVF